MAINLGSFGVIGLVFLLLLIFLFECFFGVIAYCIVSFIGFSGIFWWIVVLTVIVMFNLIFIKIN